MHAGLLLARAEATVRVLSRQHVFGRFKHAPPKPALPHTVTRLASLCHVRYPTFPRNQGERAYRRGIREDRRRIVSSGQGGRLPPVRYRQMAGAGGTSVSLFLPISSNMRPWLVPRDGPVTPETCFKRPDGSYNICIRSPLGAQGFRCVKAVLG